jgi:bifunctional UDP-N-acetylglucosamine pyrophosphorylase/glucosamine-1-phosphate N-acetyltransferase
LPLAPQGRNALTSQSERGAEMNRQTIPASDAGLAIVIMAAGKGTRLKSKRPKVLHEIGGGPLLAHVIAAAANIVAPDRIYVVIGHEADRVRNAVASSGVHFVEQTEQRGTGHAIQCAREAVAGFKSIIVLSGDVPLIRPETVERLWRFHQAQNAAMTLLTTAPPDATGYGRVVRVTPGAAEVEAIIEQKALTAEQQGIGEINAGIYAFQTEPLFAHLGKLTADNPHAELYLTDMARLLRAAGERVVAIEVPDSAEVLGANTLSELATLDATLRTAAARQLMASGVTIFRPETCVIDAGVEVAPDTVIEPFVQLLGSTRIGSDCRIRSYTVIRDCVLGDSVEVLPHCVLDGSNVGSWARIGPFANLRPGNEVGENVHIGDFVELKKTRLGNGAKANHFAYLGDTEIGPRCNIGAGTIVCNYDGTSKYQTRIGEGVFVGSNSTLVAPLTIEDGAYIGAASCITKDVPADALAVGRARQVTKQGWAAARRDRRKPPPPGRNP